MSQLPPFVFNLSEIQQTKDSKPRLDASGIWHPPRTLGANEVSSSTGKWYSFNNLTGSLEASYQADPRLQHYRTSSVYYDGARFWSVPFDAVQNQVGNGSDDEIADDDEDGKSASNNEYYYDWNPLRFDYPASYTQASSVAFPGCYARLRTDHDSHVWAQKLFPHSYHSAQPAPDPGYGGLVGDLSLLLALIAFSARPNAVEATFAQTIRGAVPWNAPQGSTGKGWLDYRGVMVNVYVLPAWRENLKAFECGHYGNIFH